MVGPEEFGLEDAVPSRMIWGPLGRDGKVLNLRKKRLGFRGYVVFEA